MCASRKASLLRASEPAALTSFSWKALGAELQQIAPTMFSVLDGTLHVHIPTSQMKRRKTDKLHCVSKAAIVGLCTAILYR